MRTILGSARLISSVITTILLVTTLLVVGTEYFGVIGDVVIQNYLLIVVIIAGILVGASLILRLKTSVKSISIQTSPKQLLKYELRNNHQYDFEFLNVCKSIIQEKNTLSEEKLSKLIDIITKLEKEKFPTNEIELWIRFSYNLLKEHYQLRLGIQIKTDNFFEDLASIAKKVLESKHFKNVIITKSDEDGLDLILGRKEIIPLKVKMGKAPRLIFNSD